VAECLQSIKDPEISEQQMFVIIHEIDPKTKKLLSKKFLIWNMKK